MRLAKEIIGTPVWGAFENKIIGSVIEIIMEPNTQKLFALKIKGDKVKKDQYLLSSFDLKYFKNDGIIIESIKTLSTKEDLPKGYELLKGMGKIMNSKVKSKISLKGRVVDFALDDDLKLTRLYIRKPFSLKSFLEEEIVNPEDILSIKKGIIQVKD